MRTDDLIARLADHPEPIRRGAAARILASGFFPGAFVAFTFTALALGLRRDFATAVGDWHFWAKFAYTAALALLAFPLVKCLSHPGVRGRRQWRELAAPFVVIALGAAWQWLAAPPDEHAALFYGGSHLVCPWLILITALPILAGTLWAMRRLAPTTQSAGAAAGLFAGAAGAFIYSLHCGETSLVFVSVWYTAGILITGVTGWLIGRFALRW